MPEEKINTKKLNNSLTGFADNLLLGAGSGFGTPVSQTLPSILNNHYDLIFNNRITLNQLYICHGIVQTLVDQPVDDAFRGGFNIVSKKLNDKTEDLKNYLISTNKLDKVQQTIKWSRLFGGAGLVILAGLNPTQPFDINKIGKYTKIDYYAADLWELNKSWTAYNIDLSKISSAYRNTSGFTSDVNYLFYGIPLHNSRVLDIISKESPSLMRPRMRGWGMSILERFLRSFNQYLKNQNVIYELLDEAKLDVFNIDQFKSSLMTSQGTSDIEKRMQITAQLKNFLNILVMDKEDEFTQKQINFGGLGDILTQIRQGIACDMKMPITKIFGVSSAGFNAGEDDIENYNSMVESEIRSKVKPLLIKVLMIEAKRMFGVVADDIMIEWNPLRVLSAQQEEVVKTRKLNRILMAHSIGAISIKEVKAQINKSNLLPLKLEENDNFYESLASNANAESADKALDNGKDNDAMVKKTV